MFCIDRASFLYGLAGSLAPVVVGAVCLLVAFVLFWRSRRG